MLEREGFLREAMVCKFEGARPRERRRKSMLDGEGR